MVVIGTLFLEFVMFCQKCFFLFLKYIERIPKGKCFLIARVLCNNKTSLTLCLPVIL